MVVILNIINGVYEIADYLQTEQVYICLKEKYKEVEIVTIDLFKRHQLPVLLRKAKLIFVAIRLTGISNIMKLLEQIKKDNPNCSIAIGGTYASIVPIETLQEYKVVDFMLTEEPDVAIDLLYEQLLHKCDYKQVPNLVYRSEIGPCFSVQQGCKMNLEEKICEREFIHKTKKRVIYIESGRGCTGQCNFCTYANFYNQWHGKKIKDVVDEMQAAVEKTGITLFGFIDASLENPYSDLRRVEELADEIIKRNFEVFYFASFKVKTFLKANDTIMSKLIKSGLVRIFLGVENFCDNELVYLNKTHSGQEAESVIRYLKKYPIMLDIGIINHTPITTVDELKYNISKLHELGYLKDFTFTSPLRIYKNTRQYEQLKKDGFLGDAISLFEYGMKIEDSSVSQYFHYINKYVKYLEKNVPNLNRIFYLSKGLNVLLEILLRVYKNDSKELDQVKNMKINLEHILSELNSKNYHWAMGLIKLTQEKWTESSADVISRQYIDACIIADILARLQFVEKNIYKFTYKNCPERMV